MANSDSPITPNTPRGPRQFMRAGKALSNRAARSCPGAVAVATGADASSASLAQSQHARRQSDSPPMAMANDVVCSCEPAAELRATIRQTSVPSRPTLIAVAPPMAGHPSASWETPAFSENSASKAEFFPGTRIAGPRFFPGNSRSVSTSRSHHRRSRAAPRLHQPIEFFACIARAP